jgi:hypothetical protein
VTVKDGYAPKIHSGWMWDLTVTADHDFYIDIPAAPILVHNARIIQANGGVPLKAWTHRVG